MANPKKALFSKLKKGFLDKLEEWTGTKPTFIEEDPSRHVFDPNGPAIPASRYELERINSSRPYLSYAMDDEALYQATKDAEAKEQEAAEAAEQVSSTDNPFYWIAKSVRNAMVGNPALQGTRWNTTNHKYEPPFLASNAERDAASKLDEARKAGSLSRYEATESTPRAIVSGPYGPATAQGMDWQEYVLKPWAEKQGLPLNNETAEEYFKLKPWIQDLDAKIEADPLLYTESKYPAVRDKALKLINGED